MGAGPIGQVLLQAARRLGTACAVADIVDVRLEKARMLDAEVTVNTKEESLEEAMEKWTGGKGVPLIIDAVGIPDLFPVFLRMASPAGRIGLLGFSKAPSELVQLEVVKKELSIYGSRLNRNKFPEVISWFGEGSVEPELLVSTLSLRKNQGGNGVHPGQSLRGLQGHPRVLDFRTEKKKTASPPYRRPGIVQRQDRCLRPAPRRGCKDTRPLHRAH